MTEEKKTPGPLSHSSASTLLECEQRYVYYKIDGAKEDSDYVKADSLGLGSAFHKVLEDSHHEKPVSISAALQALVDDPEVKLNAEDLLLCHAMVLKYLRLHKQMGLKVLAVETEIKTKWVHGFVDAIMEDADGKWWIVDLKTYKDLKPSTVAMLSRDPQLTLYAAHAFYLAEIHGLDLSKFGGCRWRVVTKSSARQKATETEADFVKRLADDHVKAYDIPVQAAMFDTQERLDLHVDLHKRTQKLVKVKPVRNYRACFNFFSPCPYWSKCYGKTYSEMLSDQEHVTVLT